MSDEETGVLEAAAPAVEEISTNQPEVSTAEQMVPVAALQAERQARQQLQEEIRAIRENMNMLAHQSRPQPTPQPQEEEEVWEDDDVLTVRQFKKALQPAQVALAEMQMYRKYPDYEEVITKHLPEVIQKQPELRQTLLKTQDYNLAYYLAKNSDSYRKAQEEAQPKAQPKSHPDAERIVANAERPGSLSSVAKSSTINDAKKWSQMSDEEFRKHVSRHLA